MKLLGGFFFKPNVDIVINEVPNRKRHKIYELDGKFNKYPTFHNLEDITGKVTINLGNKKSYEHKGIKLELLGTIQGRDPKTAFKFLTLTRELESPGALNKEFNEYDFNFQAVSLEFESYRGVVRSVKYFLRVTILTSLKTHIFEQEFAVINPEKADVYEDCNYPIEMELGIDEGLNLIFEVDKTHYSLKDVIYGRISFRKIDFKLDNMEVHILRSETLLGAGQPEMTPLLKFEIMDGSPVKNEIIPIRIYLKNYDLTPTMTNIHKKFSVQFFLKIVMTDTEDKKYFKQHEIVLHRFEKVPKNIPQVNAPVPQIKEEKKEEKSKIEDKLDE